jgi:hypothetical protein
MASKKSTEIYKKYCCEICYYYTSKITDYNKHISTDKHKKNQNASKMLVNASEKSTKIFNKKIEFNKIQNLIKIQTIRIIYSSSISIFV